jgi:hypothetical protein
VTFASGHRTWRVRTATREILIELRPRRRATMSSAEDARRTATGPGTEVLLADLFYEMARGNRQVDLLIDAIAEALTGPANVPSAGVFMRPSTALEPEQARRRERLARWVRAGDVALLPVEPVFLDVVPEPADVAPPPSDEPAAEEEEEQQTFIGVELLGPDGMALADVRLKIELPDGSVKESRTGADGRVMVLGIKQPGTAKITLPDFEADVASAGTAVEVTSPSPTA